MSSAPQRGEQAPEPEDDRKPDSPDDLTKPSRRYIVRKTMREFSE